MKRILVIRGGAIGDFVLTLPAINLLREAYPEARLEILGYKHIAALAENRFYAQAIRSIEDAALAGFFAKGADLNPELSAYFGSFDLVVSYLFDPDEVFRQNVARCGVEMFIACSPQIGRGEHAAMQLARPLEQLGLSLPEPAAKLYPSEDDREFARKFLTNSSSEALAIHPGSGSTTKNWPIEQWRALLNRLSDHELVIVGGEADERQLAALRSHNALVARNLPLPHLAAVLERCQLFVGHDSGISHVAAAVGTRCVLLFGPTAPVVWAPANPFVQALKSPTGNLNDITVEHVLDAIATMSATS